MLRIFAFALAALLPLSARAITILPACSTDGNCGITDILAMLLNLVEFGLGITGAIALFYFIYGGFTFILAAGSTEGVKKGKTILTQATIGIIIIFTSGVIVRFATEALTGRVGTVCTQQDAADKKCTPIIGSSCLQETEKSRGGFWISIPKGDKAPESLECVKIVADPECGDLNAKLEKHGVNLKYSCQPVDSSSVISCVRGLCPLDAANVACCITNAPPAKKTTQ